MPNASTSTAAKGYQIYLDLLLADTDPTLAAVNVKLEALDLEPIAQRTLTHYKRLLDHGHATYIPINRFDVNGR